MSRIHLVVGWVVLVSVALSSNRASAFFHLWRFSEVFSNADGSVQFIELQTTFNGENFSSGSQIRSLSTGNVFTFPSNLSSSMTANRKLLIATTGFGSLTGGVTPDFTFASTDFFNPAGDTLSLFAGSVVDSRTFSSLPTDGIMSRHYPSNTLAVNSPTNFAGAAGSVTLAMPSLAGDYNGSGTVEQADLDLVLLNWGLATPPAPSGWINDLPAGTIDQAELDGVLLNWGSTAAGASAVPEPAAGITVAALIATCLSVQVFAGRLRFARSAGLGCHT